MIVAIVVAGAAGLGAYFAVAPGWKETARQQLAAGKARMEAEDWPAAIACFDKAVWHDPEMTEAYLLRATAINEHLAASTIGERMRSREDALSDLKVVLERWPNSGEAHFEKGIVLLGLARISEAKKDFAKAIPLLKDPTDALVQEAFCAMHQGNYAEAVDDISHAIDRNPLEPLFYEKRERYRLLAGDFRNARYDKAKAARLRRADEKGEKVAMVDLKALEDDGGNNGTINAPQDTTEVVAEKKRLQGGWQIISNESAGHFADTTARDYSFTFEGNRYTLVLDGKIQQQDRFRLDPRKTPRWIDLGGTLNGERVTFLGIYEFPGDHMRIGLARPGQARPTDLETEGHIERTVYTLSHPEADTAR